MIISVNHMIQVSDQWLDAKRELLISEYRASHDIMTGLWNKTSGVDQVINCLENMSESDMAVLGFMDIDNFKSVNDTYGHETGVFWIREVATALQEMCGPSDIACRYGGDEYILFLQNIGGMYCLVGVSACMSLMFPTIYGIALQGLGNDAKFGAAGLIMAILGGSVLPPLQASIIDQHALFGMPAVNLSFILPFICFVVVTIYGHRSYKRVRKG